MFRNDVPVRNVSGDFMTLGLEILPSLFSMDYSWEDISTAVNFQTEDRQQNLENEIFGFLVHFLAYFMLAVFVLGSELSF
jgi:hypothetical protein